LNIALESFSLNPPRSERKRWENVLAAFAAVGLSRTHDLEIVRGRAGTRIARGSGTGRGVRSGTGRTRTISELTICRRSSMPYPEEKLGGFLPDFPQDYSGRKFKR
jgi:hypothetical protein